MFCLPFAFNYVNFCAFVHSVLSVQVGAFAWNMNTFKCELFLGKSLSAIEKVEEYVHFFVEVEHNNHGTCTPHTPTNDCVQQMIFNETSFLFLKMNEGGQSYDEVAHAAHKKAVC